MRWIAGSCMVLVMLGGCRCLEQITLKASLSTLDAKAATVGSLAPEVTFVFKGCCPTAEQERLAQGLRDRVGEAFEQYLADGATAEGLVQFNRIADAARRAITQVVLVCAGKANEEIALETVGEAFAPEGVSGEEVIQSFTGVARLTREEILMMLEAWAWAEIERVAEGGEG